MDNATDPRTEREMAENYARMLGYDPAEVLVPVTAIDRAALIEAAARAAHGAHFPWSRPDREEELRIEAAGVAASLPVIAAGLLGPLRAQAAEWREFMRDPDLTGFERSAIRLCAAELERLLDQIEAECKGGE